MSRLFRNLTGTDVLVVSLIILIPLVLFVVAIVAIVLALTKDNDNQTNQAPSIPNPYIPFSVAADISSATIAGLVTPIQSSYAGQFLSFKGSTVTIVQPDAGVTWSLLQNNSIVACTGAVLIGNVNSACLLINGTDSSGYTVGLTDCAGASGVTAAHWFLEDGFRGSVRMKNCLNGVYITNQNTGLVDGNDRYYVRGITKPEGQNGNFTMDFYLYRT